MNPETISNLLNQKQDPTEATLRKLAVALGREAPRIEPQLVLDRPAPTPLSLLRDAIEMLERLEDELGAPGAPTPDAAGADAGAVYPLGRVKMSRKAQQAEQEHAARSAPPGAPRRKRRT